MENFPKKTVAYNLIKVKYFGFITLTVFIPELHAAAKETVTLAEQRFVSKQDEWQFDSNWQEVLNHAIIKVRPLTIGQSTKKRKNSRHRSHSNKHA